MRTTYNYSFNALTHVTKKLNEVLPTIKHEHLFYRPGNSANHIMWIAGHITVCRLFMINMLSGSMVEPLYENEDKLFGNGTKPAEINMYPAIDVVLQHLTSREKKLMEALTTATDEALKRERKSELAFGGKSVEGTVHFLLWHEASHFGEINYIKNILKGI